jgi:hypothetical protein
MKVGFFGNTNNYPFMIAQALRALGHDVLFVVTSHELLNRPESRYPNFQKGYPDWIVDAAEVTEWDLITLSPALARILGVLSTCDILVLNDIGPSLWPLIRRPAIVLLTGSDLEHYANFATVQVRSANWDPAYKASADGQTNLSLLREFIQRQREGIKEAVAVRYMPRGLVPAGDAMLDEIGVPNEKRVFLPSAELELVKPTPAPHNDPVRLFCATRLTWKLPIEPGRSLLDYKGSDIMIRGLGLFYRQTGVRLDIQFVRKGLHVAEAEQLVVEEGLTDQVTWSDEMPLSEVWAEFARCDVVIEQLAQSAIGGAGLDAMAAGRPVIGNARREMFERYFGQSSPICQAQTAEEVCAQLERLVFNPEKREKLGVLGRRFVEEHCSPKRAAQTCLELLQAGFANDHGLARGTETGHGYYLQRLHDYRKQRLSLEQVLQTTEADLETSRQALRSTQTELQTNQQTLAATQAELQSTQAEVQTAQHALQTTQAELQNAQQALQTAEQNIQTFQAELLAARAHLARYQDFLPIRVVRKLRGLVKNRQ